jgi:tetratricopeptide (TPR) repeat protein
MTLTELGDFPEAMRQGEEAIRAAHTLGMVREIALSTFYLGTVCLYRGIVPEAIALFERSLEDSERIELHGLVPGASTRLSNALALEGRVDEAVRNAERAVERAAAIRRTGERSMRAAGLGEAYLVAGRLSEARQQAEEARDIAAETGECGFRAWALRLLGAITASADPPDVEKADAHYRESLELAEQLEMRPLQAHCHLGLGKLYRRIGRHDEARAELATAVSMLREMGMTFWLPEAEAELAAC